MLGTKEPNHRGVRIVETLGFFSIMSVWHKCLNINDCICNDLHETKPYQMFVSNLIPSLQL